MKEMLLISFIFSAHVFASSGAEGEVHHARGVIDLLYPSINFILLFGTAFYFARKPLKRFVREYSEKVVAKLDHASMKAKEAKNLLDIQTKKFYTLDEEVAKIVEHAKNEAIKYEEEYVNEMKVLNKKLWTDAVTQMDNEKSYLQALVNIDVVDGVTSRAKEIISKDNNIKNKISEKIINL